MSLKIKSSQETMFDVVSLGECMVRLSPPGHQRIEFTNNLEVWVGGGEYNVSYALSRLGLRTGWIGYRRIYPKRFWRIGTGSCRRDP